MTGERLGSIGLPQAPEGLPWKLPKWKEDFLAKPSVSIRRGIAWVSVDVRTVYTTISSYIYDKTIAGEL